MRSLPRLLVTQLAVLSLAIAGLLSGATGPGDRAAAAIAPQVSIAPQDVTALASDGATSGGRVHGSDRYATSAAISRHAFPQGADVVYLARGDEFADALAGGMLTDGPILLVRACGGVPGSVRAEIARLDRPRSLLWVDLAPSAMRAWPRRPRGGPSVGSPGRTATTPQSRSLCGPGLTRVRQTLCT